MQPDEDDATTSPFFESVRSSVALLVAIAVFGAVATFPAPLWFGVPAEATIYLYVFIGAMGSAAIAYRLPHPRTLSRRAAVGWGSAFGFLFSWLVGNRADQPVGEVVAVSIVVATLAGAVIVAAQRVLDKVIDAT